MQRGDVPGEIMPGEEIRQKYPCRKCLLREMDQNAYMESLYAYIARLEPGIKADETIYEKRLSVCKSCNYLMYVPTRSGRGIFLYASLFQLLI